LTILTIKTRFTFVSKETAMDNSIMIIAPYWYQGTWVFDDEYVGLVKEPFVEGIPEMINRLVEDIPDARQGFKLLFSASPFPRYEAELTWERSEYEGNWYKNVETSESGWLCPALFKYFDVAPEKIYVKAERLGH
jgi:hypothetical protein